MSTTLRILEPKLNGNAGHYAEFARALADRCAPRFDILEVHGGKGVEGLPLLSHPNVRAVATCTSRNEMDVMRRLSSDRGTPLLILTAKARHALALQAFALSSRDQPGHVNLFFHWREDSFLQRMAMRAARSVRQRSTALAPTSATASFLREQGWHRTVQVPYPARAPLVLQPIHEAPSHLLVAGAARRNKGIHLIAHLADRYAEDRALLPMLVQTTGKRAGRHGADEHEPMAQLERCRWSGLQLDSLAPDRDGYSKRFDGALVLTPYDPRHFADNVSGIALDALLHGSPIVATAGTWQASLVERFGCGVIMHSWDEDCLERSIARGVADWAGISMAARHAAAVLAREHDPRHVIDAISTS
jgi:hypothetical protein